MEISLSRFYSAVASPEEKGNGFIELKLFLLRERTREGGLGAISASNRCGSAIFIGNGALMHCSKFV